RGSDAPTVVAASGEGAAAREDEVPGAGEAPGEGDGSDQAPTVVVDPGTTHDPATPQDHQDPGDPDAPGARDEPGTAAGTDPEDDQDAMVTPKKKSPRKKRRLAKAGIWVGVVVLLLAGAYVGSAYFLAERVPADTTVAGVDISGLSAEQAEEVLGEELGALE